MIELTDDQRDALAVLAEGVASRSGQTRSDMGRGIHTVRGVVGNELIALGLAADVQQWNALEITEAGRLALGR